MVHWFTLWMSLDDMLISYLPTTHLSRPGNLQYGTRLLIPIQSYSFIDYYDSSAKTKATKNDYEKQAPPVDEMLNILGLQF